ncbi:hypothetical protein GCM10009665_02140 [Kitasatospora nipponensis]|uniref:Uncharacterized protein n=1 Tax=Kitasatospora nipponensis TaxID=258049 RepID=A0ABP4G708_9ACTN
MAASVRPDPIGRARIRPAEVRPAEVRPAEVWPERAARTGRPTLEVFEHGELVDVLVASTLNGELLRGARRAVSDGRTAGFAWGRVAADGTPPSVAFAGARLRPLWRPVRLRLVEGGFWLAWAPGPLVGVLARRPDGGAERLRPGHRH